ncbi:MAG: alkaline phosphatase family protein [Bryobacteraceae bacterium]
MNRILLSLVLVAGFSPSQAAVPVKKPKLVLAVVIDQFRYDYLNRFRKDYSAGFVRLFEHGAVFTDAHHVHFPTVTAVGHSTFLSGATPSISGIVANDWYDRESGKRVTSVSDESVKLLGGGPNKTGSSPHRLLVSTIGDELKMQGRQSKVIGVSIKDRSAILPGGHMADGAYWYDDGAHAWVSSTYYMPDLPKWVKDANQSHAYQRYAKAEWLPVDAQPGAKPFCTMTRSATARYCGSIEATPWGNELIESFAEQAIAAEQLGRHTDTDVLAVSFSSNDYVGHAMGPDSPEVRDISIRTDRILGKLLDYVDSQVGAGNTLFVMTADHGVTPVPELNHARKMLGGRLSDEDVVQRIDTALSEKYGDGKWVIGRSGPTPYLNYDLMASKKADPVEVRRAAADAIRAMPHVFRVYTRDQLLSGQLLEDYISVAVRNGFFRQRSGDLFIIPEAYYIFDKPPGTSHGTPFNYDTHVPVIFMGAGIKPGEYDSHIAVNDIAPTLATLLGIEEPSGSVGRILNEMLE